MCTVKNIKYLKLEMKKTKFQQSLNHMTYMEYIVRIDNNKKLIDSPNSGQLDLYTTTE